ncbi:MAG: peptidoglycan editing factor PgeF [Pseudomonadota bacterium]
MSEQSAEIETALAPIQSDVLAGTRHGFFTRRGGVSEGLYAGLNCGAGSGDRPEAVAENRARAAAWLGLKPEALAGVHQVHSADVVHVAEPQDGARPRADGLVTATPGLALGILTADCQPVLFADREAGVIGAAHAGWRGALGGVLEATLEAMETLGASRNRISAAIGPSIGPDAYEVDAAYRDHFVAEAPESASLFKPGKPGKYLFDLPGFGLSRLRAAGVGRATWTGHCTYGAPDLFYSYRRSCHENAPDYGRLLSAIRL